MPFMPRSTPKAASQMVTVGGTPIPRWTVTAVDDNTFEWELSVPAPGLLDTLAAAPSHFAMITLLH
jgi:hypothetical protein